MQSNGSEESEAKQGQTSKAEQRRRKLAKQSNNQERKQKNVLVSKRWYAYAAVTVCAGAWM
jgi:hypothetical protein